MSPDEWDNLPWWERRMLLEGWEMESTPPPGSDESETPSVSGGSDDLEGLGVHIEKTQFG